MPDIAVDKTLREIAELVSGEVVGDPAARITGISGIKEAREGDITFVANPKYNHLIELTGASAILTYRNAKAGKKSIIKVDDPSFAFAQLISKLIPFENKMPAGIHPSAVIGKNVSLGKDVAVGANAVISEEVEVGEGTCIYSGVFLGFRSRVGRECVIYPNVVIREKVEVGNRVIIHGGSVIGSDGFGFATVKGIHKRIPQIGTVIIEDDVDIGANVTIDRARFDKTVIGKGTKIDNLVQIAHNVVIGENSIIVSQVGISGSAQIGNNVVIAGQVGIVGHIEIGDNVLIAAKAGVSKSVPANTKLWGVPAKPFNEAKKINACIQRLPKLYEKIEALEKQVSDLKEKLKIEEKA